jgi:hypothetical protein
MEPSHPTALLYNTYLLLSNSIGIYAIRPARCNDRLVDYKTVVENFGSTFLVISSTQNFSHKFYTKFLTKKAK